MIMFLSAEDAVVRLARDEISVSDLGKTVIIQLGNQQDSHVVISSLTLNNPKFIDLGWEKDNDAFECAVMAVAGYINSRRVASRIKAVPNHVAARPEILVAPSVVTTKPAYVPVCPFTVCDDFTLTAKKTVFTCPPID
jgi:hypothetical protein